MDNEQFISELEKYSISDLELIVKTQKELYSTEEMQIIEDMLQEKKASKKKKRSDIDFAETLFCIVGLLSPLSGLITGIIMLIVGSENWKRVGRRTLIATAISVIIIMFLYSGGIGF